MGSLATVLGHQGGWDEILFVAAPLAVIAGVLWIANRRAGSFAGRGEDAEPEKQEGLGS